MRGPLASEASDWLKLVDDIENAIKNYDMRRFYGID